MQTIKDELAPVLIIGVLLANWTFLLVQQLPVPDMLEALIIAVVTYYFGSKATKVGAENGAAKAAATTPHPPRSTDPPTEPPASPNAEPIG